MKTLPEKLLKKATSGYTPTLDLGVRVRVCIVRREMGLCPLAFGPSLAYSDVPTRGHHPNFTRTGSAAVGG